MKALILASGIGSRLRPFTDKTAKNMIKLNGDTILDSELKILSSAGINDVVITTGPFGEKVEKHVSRRYPGLRAEYVKNPDYETTNYIYSIWLARKFLNDDIILMHGDLVFDYSLLEKLLECRGSGVLVNNKIEPPEKDFKGVIIGGKVTEIGVEFHGKNAFFLAPLYKFLKDDFKVWMDEIEKFVKNNMVKCYAEDAFNNVSEKISLEPVYYRDEFCMEIDTREDLERAKSILAR